MHIHHIEATDNGHYRKVLSQIELMVVDRLISHPSSNFLYVTNDIFALRRIWERTGLEMLRNNIRQDFAASTSGGIFQRTNHLSSTLGMHADTILIDDPNIPLYTKDFPKFKLWLNEMLSSVTKFDTVVAVVSSTEDTAKLFANLEKNGSVYVPELV